AESFFNLLKRKRIRRTYKTREEAPMDVGGEDFRGEVTLGYQHLIVDHGGDGMPYGQILLRTSANPAGGGAGQP
ncbi:MAG TPA: hypothetical protein VLA45_01560, partial [Paracoccaceae bacterium]|nr:hypothetical protein [Paracoccaceae bacterium]